MPPKNHKHTKEAIQKCSMSKRGRKNPMFGLCGKLSPSFGLKRSKKTRLKLIKNHKGMTGLNHTEKSKRLMKFVWKKRIGTPEYKKYIIELRERRFKQIFPTKDSKPEIIVQNELKKRNIKFKKHISIIGQPDIFIKPNICIFVDGDYVHGNPIKYKQNDLTMNGMTVKEKYKYDEKINKKLKKLGYIVLRFWETDINKNVNKIGNKIMEMI